MVLGGGGEEIGYTGMRRCSGCMVFRPFFKKQGINIIYC